MVEKSVALETARAFVMTCIKTGVPVKQAILFGSYAKGEQRTNSDIDVALISDAFTWNFIENNHQTALINYHYPDIEVHHFNAEDFKNETSLINEIKRTGIKIYGE